MRNEHIISLLENTPFASLGENDLIAIRTHAEICSDCLRAFQAAQVSRLLLKERAAVDPASEFQPSPFFHTRVLATLRERQTANDSWAFPRLWRAAGALASSMAAAVAMLAVLTFVIPETQVVSGSQVSSLRNGYSAEEVLLDQTSQAEEVSDGQMLTTIYSEDEEASK
jgi:anti-sigma-K factor RskA